MMVVPSETEYFDPSQLRTLARMAGGKSRLILRECKSFYSQYDGQSWKNVLSIGPSYGKPETVGSTIPPKPT